jgi:dihydroflavonol-4-reductase
MSAKGVVLVTGGTGYIAGFCIAQLLREGWQVRTTVRDQKRAPDVRATLTKLGVDPAGVSFFTADLMSDAGWAEANAGAQYVMHVASPLPTADPKSADDLIVPAREGALRALRFARDAGVKRVVMTSSVAAIAYGRDGKPTPHTEEDWSDDTNLKDIGAYERSKTGSERAAWAFMKREGGALELATVNPGAVLGPAPNGDFSASLEIVKLLLDGGLPACPGFGFPIVDVRDVADLHYRAMLAPNAAGQRYIAANGYYRMVEVARVLKRHLPKRKIPTSEMPGFMLRLAGMFNPIIGGRLYELDKRRDASSDKAKRELGWSPRPIDEAIIASADDLIAQKVV